jgi:hypothetical protein
MNLKEYLKKRYQDEGTIWTFKKGKSELITRDKSID